MSTTHPASGTKTIENYLGLVKFSHTIFAMPFALIGFFLAIWHFGATFEWALLIEVVLCMVFARNAAMGFNRYLDRDIDAKNPRTAIREIPAGKIKANHALTFTIVNCLLFILTTYFINQICFYLSPVALFVILFYSYTKRFTALCHLVLGVGLGLAPIGAFLSVTGSFDLLPILLSFAVFTWTAGFDIIYALQDEDFDKGMKLHSIPSYLGKRNALLVSTLLHVCTFVLILLFGLQGGFSWIFWIGMIFFTSMLIYQHMIVKPSDLSRINQAFGTTNGVASVIFAAFTLLDLFLNK